MASDVLLNKVAAIERCLARVESEYQGHEDELETNYTRQDSIILNLQRACEASIDAAMHLVRSISSVCRRSQETLSICLQKQASSMQFYASA